MDFINLPLLLFLSVAITGAIWLFDILVLRKPRLQALSQVEGQFQHIDPKERENDAGYIAAKKAAAVEPSYVEYSKSFFPVLLLVFVLRSFVIEPFQIPSESMVPTLEVGDFIVVNKFAYGIRLPIIRKKIIPINEPKRGDVMVFFPPHESRYFIKRVIGLPGDTIRYSNNVLYVNGKKAEQFDSRRAKYRGADACSSHGGHYLLVDEELGGKTHLMRKCSLPTIAPSSEWKVPAGHYFMMGDNRDKSSDSRYWGTVPEERIVGKAFAIWMHWDKFLSMPSFSRVGSI